MSCIENGVESSIGSHRGPPSSLAGLAGTTMEKECFSYGISLELSLNLQRRLLSRLIMEILTNIRALGSFPSVIAPLSGPLSNNSDISMSIENETIYFRVGYGVLCTELTKLTTQAGIPHRLCWTCSSLMQGEREPSSSRRTSLLSAEVYPDTYTASFSLQSIYTDWY
jgi:hypothetical protein